jgi:cytochrome c-type biogenesis protein CcmH/NrfF
MSELVIWVTPILLWVLVALQLADYKRRKAISAEIQKLIALVKGEQHD